MVGFYPARLAGIFVWCLPALLGRFVPDPDPDPARFHNCGAPPSVSPRSLGCLLVRVAVEVESADASLCNTFPVTLTTEQRTKQ